MSHTSGEPRPRLIGPIGRGCFVDKQKRMEQPVPQRERRQHGRRSDLLVHVSVKDQDGHVCQGTVLNVSEGGVGLFTQSLPTSELLEIQPANSTVWIRVVTKHFTPSFSGYVVGCAFQFPPTPDILQALYVPR